MKGKESIKLNKKIKCDNAYWVDSLKYNLLSVEQLISSGCKVGFQNRLTNIYDGTSELVGSGEQTRGNLFYLDLFEDTLYLHNVKMFGYGIRGYVM